MNNLSTGRKGEDIAAEYLKKLGYKILETNKRFSRYCEIDIIAKDKDTVVFCEVKTRNTEICGSPFEAITKTKYNNIKKGIYFYRLENADCKKFRIDAIAIILKPGTEIKHLKNIAF